MFSSLAFHFCIPATLAKAYLPIPPRFPISVNDNNDYPIFQSWKLRNYSSLFVSPSCHFSSIHRFYWFYFCPSILHFPAPLHLHSQHHHHHLLPRQSEPSPNCTRLFQLSCFPSPIYNIPAAKIIVLKTKTDYGSFLFRKTPSSFLPLGFYALLFH